MTKCLGAAWKSGENVSMWLTAGLGDSAAEGENAATQELLFTME